MKINRKKINKAILEIKQLGIKYDKADTMFICHALDEALKKIGWDYLESYVKKDKFAKKREI